MRPRRLRRTRLLELATLVAVAAGLAVAVPGFSSEEAPSAVLTPAPPPRVAPDDVSALAAAHTPPSNGTPRPTSYLIARPRSSSVALRSRPGGSIVARPGGTTEFGSQLRLGVVRRSGKWLGVATPLVPNGRLAWVYEPHLLLSRTSVSLTLDLSARRLVLRRGDRVLRRMTVGIGRPGSPTPRGRFAVTDKLAGTRYGPYYGCCIVALSARQPNLPAGWTGGDRIAIHGTNDPSSIGAATSAGCPHAGAADMRALMRAVPLGAPVFVRA